MGMRPRGEGPKIWGPTRTKQSEEAKCNINNIISMYTRTKQLTHVSEALGEYRDMTTNPANLHEALNIVANANSLFHELPGEVRKRLGHNVGNLLPFIDDPENLAEAIDMGLLPESMRPKPEKRERDQDSLPVVENTTESPVQGGE